MRLILAGTRSFGAAALECILEDGHTVLEVVAPPGDALWSEARKREIRTDTELSWQWIGSDVDLIVCAHSHLFVSGAARGRTKLGAIGYHPSLLPRHRGRDAVEWTVRMGDPVAGGSVYWLTDNVDGGPIAAAEHVMVRPGWDASDLWRQELFPMGLRLLRGVLRDLDGGRLVEIPQDEACATWEPSIGRPPLHRPDLLQIGKGPNGYKVVTRKEDRV